jgi:purine nucleosidase
MRLIIDTDAGVDDSQAILMALTHGGARVEAITTVTGNVHVDKVNRNVIAILALMGMRIPIYSGATLPLVEPWHAGAPEVHGDDGLGNWTDRPHPLQGLEREHAVNALVRLVNENPGQYTIVALGPLTNLAMAQRLDPSFASKVKQLYFMGGTLQGVGNTTTVTAEFNIWCDPEAAHIVLSSFPRATMLSWETTLAHPIDWDTYGRLANMGSPRSRFFRDTTRVISGLMRSYGFLRGYLLPDPLAMAIALEPALIRQAADYIMMVELRGTHTRGQTVIDHMARTGLQPNVTAITEIDMAGVVRLYERMLR